MSSDEKPILRKRTHYLLDKVSGKSRPCWLGCCALESDSDRGVALVHGGGVGGGAVESADPEAR